MVLFYQRSWLHSEILRQLLWVEKEICGGLKQVYRRMGKAYHLHWKYLQKDRSRGIGWTTFLLYVIQAMTLIIGIAHAKSRESLLLLSEQIVVNIGPIGEIPAFVQRFLLHKLGKELCNVPLSGGTVWKRIKRRSAKIL